MEKAAMRYLLALALISATTFAHAELIEFTTTLHFSADKPDQVKEWQAVGFADQAVLKNPVFGDSRWQLRVKQAAVSTNKGKAALIKTSKFETVTTAPSDAEFKEDRLYDPWGPLPEDTYNENLMEWGEYYFTQGHLHEPRPYVFVVETSDGHVAKLQFLDYVKNGLAIRLVEGTDIWGRRKIEHKSVRVGQDDGLVHLSLRLKYNTEAGSRKLE